MKSASLALRNLLRNRRRSLTTLAAVAIGAVSVLLFGGYRTNRQRAGGRGPGADARMEPLRGRLYRAAAVAG